MKERNAFMSQQIEIEFKNLLTKEEFERLSSFLGLASTHFHKQENHYFDTPQFSLKEKGAALRIRAKNGKYVLTLKEPAKIGLLETHQPLSEDECKNALQTFSLPESGEVLDRLIALNIEPSNLQYFGTLTTYRAEKRYENGLVILDHSRYLNKEDFEIEYEVDDESQGKKQFLTFLQTHNIPVRKTENKIKRFYLAKYEQC
jgi:uncharacterized protein YjbK